MESIPFLSLDLLLAYLCVAAWLQEYLVVISGGVKLYASSQAVRK